MIEILKAGLYTTIQDQGRVGYSHFGVPISGAMDSMSANNANALLGNSLHDSVMECTVLGPKILFQKETLIAITGAVVQPFINGVPTYMNTVIGIKEGDILSFGKIVNGARFYIGILGGFRYDSVLNSQSVCVTSKILCILKNGDQIRHAERKSKKKELVNTKRIIGCRNIQVVKGPEYELLESSGLNLKKILSVKFKVDPRSNRMAYRVSHNLNLAHQQSIISSATLPGTVQLTPCGDLLFLMRDGQTTGGYPRIFQMNEKGICDLAQLKAGDKFQVLIEM